MKDRKGGSLRGSTSRALPNLDCATPSSNHGVPSRTGHRKAERRKTSEPSTQAQRCHDAVVATSSCAGQRLLRWPATDNEMLPSASFFFRVRPNRPDVFELDKALMVGETRSTRFPDAPATGSQRLGRFADERPDKSLLAVTSLTIADAPKGRARDFGKMPSLGPLVWKQNLFRDEPFERVTPPRPMRIPHTRVHRRPRISKEDR